MANRKTHHITIYEVEKAINKHFRSQADASDPILEELLYSWMEQGGKLFCPLYPEKPIQVNTNKDIVSNLASYNSSKGKYYILSYTDLRSVDVEIYDYFKAVPLKVLASLVINTSDCIGVIINPGEKVITLGKDFFKLYMEKEQTKKDELADAIEKSDKSYEDVLKFVNSKTK